MTNLIPVGIDLGNKNLKVSGEKGHSHEIPIAFGEVEKYDYDEEKIRDDMEKVKYKNKYFFIGMTESRGLPKNKADKTAREEANMFKLIGLAQELRRLGKTKGEFYVVTGTPLQDFNAYHAGYKELMLTQDNDYEKIELDHIEYEIKVSNAYITKQAAVVAATLGNIKDKDVLIIDLGGGTLDAALFVDGVKDEHITSDYPLNKILENLGNHLNDNGLGLPRPNEYDAQFLKYMEDIVLRGSYKQQTEITIDGKLRNLKEYANQWLQSDIDDEINEINRRLDLTPAQSKYTEVYYIGGGAKLLETQLNNNKTFGNARVIENPHYINVETYRAIAEQLVKRAQVGNGDK